MKFVGWIKARKTDKKRLQWISVKGDMIYNKTEGCFEYCEIGFWTGIILKLFWPRFYLGAFTNIKSNWQLFW